MREKDRQNSLLTASQREMLEEMRDGTGESMRRKRSRMRDRINAGLLDFPLLFRRLREDDRDLLLGLDPQGDDSSGGRPSREKTGQLYDSMVAVVALICEFSERLGWDFEAIVREGVDEYASGPRTDPHQTIDTLTVEFAMSESELEERKRTYDRAVRKFERGEVLELTDREVRILVELADINAPTLIEEFREKKREQHREKNREESAEEMKERIDMFTDTEGDEE